MDIDTWVETLHTRESSGVSATETTSSTCGAFELTVRNRTRRDGSVPTQTCDHVENIGSTFEMDA